MSKAFRMLAWIVLGILSFSVNAHSHLGNPLPTRRLDCRAGNGRHRNCYGPCPPLDTYGEPTGISPSKPSETWRRGEERIISWHRNNHGDGESGFVRLSLVPVDQMFNKNAHQKFTIQISCWSSGLHWCPSRNVHVCGNDAEGKAYKVPIVVPTVYPDGVYAFGWVWYGGGDWRERSFFGDYYSCSFIRIEGGAGLLRSYRPVFVAGIQQPYSDACMAATNKVGHCVREPCHIGPVKAMRPRNLPKSISVRDLGYRGTASTNADGDDEKPKPPPGQRGGRRKSGQREGRRESFKIVGLQVINLRTRGVRTTKRKKLRIKVSTYKKGFTLGLQVKGNVEKVRFDMRGYDHTEYVSPYIINGNFDGDLNPVRCRKGKVLKITCTVFGHDGETKSEKFKIKCV